CMIGAEDAVHFLGYQADLAAFYHRATVVWIPSHTAGGVNVVLEAMATGRPVVASRLPALAEIIADGTTGSLIDPDNNIAPSIALARQTRLLLNDPQRSNQLGEAGRQEVENRFAVGQLVEHFTRLYGGPGASTAAA